MSADLYRLGRLTTVKCTFGNVDFPVSDIQILAPDNQRVAVALRNAHPNTEVKFGVMIDGEVRPLGLTTDNNETIYMSLLTHGKMPTFAFFLMTDPGNESNYDVWEWFLTEEVLQDTITNYKSGYRQ